MDNYSKHAWQEFEAAGWCNKDHVFKCEMQELMCKQVIELLEQFSKHGHSGSTAIYALNLFEKLAKFEPIVPIIGTDDEWVEIANGVLQNKRCGHVFKENGVAYDIEGKVFRDPDGCCYTTKDSRVVITFPYTPKTEIVQR
jgi:hypothetical protein